MGTETQILRLSLDAFCYRKMSKDKLQKKKNYLLFIDFKSVFDSIIWRILVNELASFKMPLDIMNTNKQLYHHAHSTP